MNGRNLAYTLPPPNLVMPHVIQFYMIAVFGGGANVLAIYATYVAVITRMGRVLMKPITGQFEMVLDREHFLVWN